MIVPAYIKEYQIPARWIQHSAALPTILVGLEWVFNTCKKTVRFQAIQSHLFALCRCHYMEDAHFGEKQTIPQTTPDEDAALSMLRENPEVLKLFLAMRK